MTDPHEQFARERAEAVAEMARDAGLKELSQRWMLASARHGYTYNFRWLGRPIIQFPQDIVALQELVWEVRPDVIVETGVAHGGGTVFFASMLELLGGDGRVVGIDVEVRPHNRAALREHPLWHRIELIEGSSADPEVVARVRRRLKPADRVLVVLDSDHTHDHVLAELRLWSPLVGTGSYVVVMDTSVEHAPAELFEGRPFGPGDSPGSAARAFLSETDRFEVDSAREDRLLITVAPGGWLRCADQATWRPPAPPACRPASKQPSRDPIPVVTGVGSPPGRGLPEVPPGLPIERRSCACRWCGARLERVLVDLGKSPLANSFVPWDRRDDPELFLPLCAYVCDSCLLVQVPEFAPAESIFSDYLYFSSYSKTWLQHNAALARELVARLGLDGRSRVVEIASNDGYMLRNFVQAGIPCLGVEPAANVAKVAIDAGIPTRVGFFGCPMAVELVERSGPADLVLAINVLPHVPGLRDFVAGLSELLASDGVLLLEFPSLRHLLADGLFDTIYHEHFSYFSLHVLERILGDVGLSVFDVRVRLTHGGSLRVMASPAGSGRFTRSPEVDEVLRRDRAAGLRDPVGYGDLQARADATKAALLSFLLDARQEGQRVVGYGAPAKGNTLLNYCGVGRDLLEFTVDLSPHKQGTWLPGTGIPVLHPDVLEAARPDFVLVLPWNLRHEIAAQLRPLREVGTRLVVALPELEILE